jgi:hypothetical protein
MTTQPSPAPARRTRRRQNLTDAICYVLEGAAGLVTDDSETASTGMLQGGAEAACGMYELPPVTAALIYSRAGYWLARASGYQPLDTADPVIDRALAELPRCPPERQARLLAYASRRAAGQQPGPP